MTVTISAEDRRRLDRIVGLGNFASVQEALHACIDLAEPLLEQPKEAAWIDYVTRSIEAGLRSAECEPLIPAEEVLAELRTRRRHAA